LYDDFSKIKIKIELGWNLLSTVILSNFRRTRTVLHSILSYQTQTAPNYFYNKTRVRGVESNYRTIIKNIEIFLKTRVIFKKKS
jgi:hypothetical protein